MFKDGGTRLQISLISGLPESVRGELATASLEDLLSRKVKSSTFATAIIQINPVVQFTLIHPEISYQLNYRPSTDIATPFFYIEDRPLQNTGHTMETMWPAGIGAIFSIVGTLERIIADQTQRDEIPYLPLLPAWRVYRNLGV